jgi:dihydrofolate reductase
MPTLLDMAISLDGYVAAPGGGDAGLHDWYFDPPPASVPIIDELVVTTGAIVIGRAAYEAGGAAGWDDTPYRVRHVVITHRPPERPPDRTIDFVFAGGVAQAMDLAVAAAGARWVVVGGGADIARQLLAAGLVDELQLHVVPVMLGAGLRLFEPSAGAHRLRVLRVVESSGVTHLRYAIASAGYGRGS